MTAIVTFANGKVGVYEHVAELHTTVRGLSVRYISWAEEEIAQPVKVELVNIDE
jgi:hypothetical protein